MNKTFHLILFFILIFSTSFGQTVLSLEEARNIALENNYFLKISQKNIDLAENEIYNGNVGKAPLIDLNGSVSNSVSQVHQKYLDGRDIQRIGNSFTPLTNINMLWTLYDGKRMFANMDRYKSIHQQAKSLTQIDIQNTLYNVIQSYYDIIKLQKSSEYLGKIIKYYEERLRITEERWQIGRGSKLDYIQSKTDLITQKSILINNDGQLKVAKYKLNMLLGRNINVDYNVNEIQNSILNYNLDELIEFSKSRNPEYINLLKAEEITELDQKVAYSYRLPKVSLNSGFGYNLNKSNANLLSFNQTIGLNAGLVATWRIFDGQTVKHNVEKSKINEQITILQQQDWVNTTTNSIIMAYQNLQTNRELINIENENKVLAEENLNIAIEKFKLGASTILELNEAQTRYNNAMNRQVLAQYNANLAELNLLKYSGLIIH